MTGDDAEPRVPQVPGFGELEYIASGGFSVVYRAKDQALDRVVALKVLPVAMSSALVTGRFGREMKTMAQLSGTPNIVDIYRNCLTEDGEPCIVMRYMAGGSLAQLVQARGPLGVSEVIGAGESLANALYTAHQTGITHRDIKPQNVLLDANGVVALGDFGLAVADDQMVSEHSQLIATPAHAPPEVLNHTEGQLPSRRAADIYSLGSTLYTLLAGRPPFGTQESQGALRFMDRVVNEPVPAVGRDDVSDAAYAVLARAMAKEPEDRYPDARAFADALAALPHGQARFEPLTAGERDGLGTVAKPTADGAAPSDGGDTILRRTARQANNPADATNRAGVRDSSGATVVLGKSKTRSPAVQEDDARNALPTLAIVLVVVAVLLVAGVAIMLARAGQDNATNLSAPSSSPAAVAQAPGSIPVGSLSSGAGAPVVESMRALSSGGLAFTWSDPSTSGLTAYQVSVDGRAATTEEMAVDQSGSPMREQVVTDLTVGGRSQRVEPAAHKYCVVVRHVGTSGSADSQPKCLEPGTPATAAP